MRLTVESIIEKCGFSDFRIFAGKSGMGGREVTTVCVVDIVDIEGWVLGGEFLLTSGYIFKDYPEQLVSLVEAAHKGGAVALGIKTGRYIEQIPGDLLKTADRLSFPIVGIPSAYVHTDIINAMMRVIKGEQVQDASKLEGIRQRFFDLTITDGDIASILQLLCSYTKREIIFLNSATGERIYAAESSDFALSLENLPSAAILNSFPHDDIILGSKTQGYIVIDKPINKEPCLTALNQAKLAIQLRLKWTTERSKIERGRDSQLVQDIVYKRCRHEAEILDRARPMGWELSGRQAVAIIDVVGESIMKSELEESRIRTFEIFRQSLNQLQTNVPYAIIDDCMTFILKASAESWDGTKKGLARIAQSTDEESRLKTGMQLVMGVGSPVESAYLCAKSFREAKRTLSLAMRSDNLKITPFWDDMGVYRLLLPTLDTEDSADFINECLGPLINSKRLESSSSLLQTLFCIIKNSWQLKPVASVMNLHYNTVKYRYAKIGEILGVDMESHKTRINLAIAMELYTLKKLERGKPHENSE